MTFFPPGGAKSAWRTARLRGFRLHLRAATVAFTASCQPSASSVDLRAHLGAEWPLAGLEVTASPYDVNGILDSLERVALSPPPQYPELEGAMEAFRMRGTADFGEISDEWMRARATVNALADSLNAAGRDAPGYSRAFRRFRDLYDHLVAKEAQLEAAARELTADDRALATEAARAADSLRQWEREAFRDFEAIAEKALRRSGRTAQTATTEADGRVTLMLEPGSWWLIARLPHPENPFQEFFWNVPFRVGGFAPLVVPLTAHNVTQRWRH